MLFFICFPQLSSQFPSLAINMISQQFESDARLKARHVGGIDYTEVTFEPGVTVLAGRNATNRTSLLQALMAVLGSDDVSIKAGADEAYVEMSIDGKTYTRSIQRHENATQDDGMPLIDDSTLADLFAFLLESNAARRAVITEGDLHDMIMQPIDTEDIDTEIEHLVNERRRVSNQLDELNDLKNKLSALKQQRTQLKENIAEKQAELAAVEQEIQRQDTGVKEGQTKKSELESKLNTLREKQSSLEDVQYELQTQEDSLESLRKEQSEMEQVYEELPDTPDDLLSELEEEISQLRSKKQTYESELSDIQNLISFNEQSIKDDAYRAINSLSDTEDSGQITDELVSEERGKCWTCGNEVAIEQIETTIESMRNLSEKTVSRISTIESELSELADRYDELETAKQRRHRVESRRDEIQAEIKDTQARINNLSERHDTLRTEITALESDVESLENNSHQEIVSLHKEANQLENQLGRLENDVERKEKNIQSIQERVSKEDSLTDRRETIDTKIEELRTRKERIENQAIKKFNEHMDTILDLLEYDNISRVWIERKERDVRDGRQVVSKTIFDLHIIRRTESNTSYEDNIRNLSQSEREVTGLIFALSGYLAHDVHEAAPFILLDAIESIDSDRIAKLVDYLDDFCEFLVVALLPEDAAALPEEYHRIESI
jgi:DNA repair exonuclease SbcCD ATPase subunit